MQALQPLDLYSEDQPRDEHGRFATSGTDRAVAFGESNHAETPEGKEIVDRLVGNGDELHMHREIAVRVVNEFGKLAAQYPEVAKNVSLRNMHGWEMQIDPSIATTELAGGVFDVRFSPKYLGESEADVDRMLSENEVGGWITAGTVEGIVAHEFGHALLDSALPAGQSLDSFSMEALSQAGTNDMTHVQHEISQYATSNPRDFVAETFADVQIHPNPSEISKSVVSWLDGKYREKFGSVTAAGDFDESLHPRDEKGRFATSDGGGSAGLGVHHESPQQMRERLTGQGMDPEIARDITQQFIELQRDFPTVASHTHIDTSDELDEGIIADTGTERVPGSEDFEHYIRFNEEKVYDERVFRDELSLASMIGNLYVGTPEETLAHEFTHAMMNELDAHGAFGPTQDWRDLGNGHEGLYGDIEGRMVSLNEGGVIEGANTEDGFEMDPVWAMRMRSGPPDGMSAYGMTSPDEFVAEGYGKYTVDPSGPRAISTKVGRWLDGEMRKHSLTASGFDESQHPRDEKGRFTESDGGDFPPNTDDGFAHEPGQQHYDLDRDLKDGVITAVHATSPEKAQSIIENGFNPLTGTGSGGVFGTGAYGSLRDSSGRILQEQLDYEGAHLLMEVHTENPLRLSEDDSKEKEQILAQAMGSPLEDGYATDNVSELLETRTAQVAEAGERNVAEFVGEQLKETTTGTARNDALRDFEQRSMYNRWSVNPRMADEFSNWLNKKTGGLGENPFVNNESQALRQLLMERGYDSIVYQTRIEGQDDGYWGSQVTVFDPKNVRVVGHEEDPGPYVEKFQPVRAAATRQHRGPKLVGLLEFLGASLTAGGDFDEEKHPRDEHGRFADGPGYTGSEGVDADAERFTSSADGWPPYNLLEREDLWPAVAAVDANPKMQGVIAKFGTVEYAVENRSNPNALADYQGSRSDPTVTIYSDPMMDDMPVTDNDVPHYDRTGNSWEDTLRHEYGHHVFDQLGRQGAEEGASTSSLGEWRSLYNAQTGRDWNPDKYHEPDPKRLVSSYANTNPNEGFAETFMVVTDPKYTRDAWPPETHPSLDWMSAKVEEWNR